jgi:hypothetical protein
MMHAHVCNPHFLHVSRRPKLLERCQTLGIGMDRFGLEDYLSTRRFTLRDAHSQRKGMCFIRSPSVFAGYLSQVL